MTLERDLRALGAGLPDPPALAPAVLAAVGRASQRRRRRRRVAVLALALLLLVPATVLAVAPGLRNRVLQTFGLRGVTVVRVARLPPVGPDAHHFMLGERVSLRTAQSLLGVRVHPPTALGTPDGIFRAKLTGGVDVSFLYERPTVAKRLGVHRRVIMSILRGTLDDALLQKTVATATHVTRLRIDGGKALLISGPPHLFMLFRSGNQIDVTHTRLAGTTLLWQRGRLIVRVEGDLSRARLVAIARSFTTG